MLTDKRLREIKERTPRIEEESVTWELLDEIEEWRAVCPGGRGVLHGSTTMSDADFPCRRCGRRIKLRPKPTTDMCFYCLEYGFNMADDFARAYALHGPNDRTDTLNHLVEAWIEFMQIPKKQHKRGFGIRG